MRAIQVFWPLVVAGFLPGSAGLANSPASATARLMTPADLIESPREPPDRRIAYGDSPSQYGELRLPTGRGPHPVVVLIHGGCFKAEYATSRDLDAMAGALKAVGIASWNIEYRRLGEAGAGWPGTYLDVGRAIDHLREIAPAHDLDLGRVVLVGHSAGGHLAMWGAARARLPSDSALRTDGPLVPRGVVNLAGPMDLSANVDGYEALCRDRVITSLMGGTARQEPARYAQASPITLVPTGVPQVIIVGEFEEFVPRKYVDAYAARARATGDTVQLIVIPSAGHFEIASPRTSAWPRLRDAILALLDGRLPASDAPELLQQGQTH